MGPSALTRRIRAWAGPVVSTALLLSAVSLRGGASALAGAETNAGRPGLPFAPTRPRAIELTLPAESLRSLRRDSRAWVPARWHDGLQTLTNVGVRLKGRTGSFRPVDDKPSLTVDFAHFEPGQSWSGLSRLHLNNSVEDPSYQHERLGGELFRAAGIPAPQVTHGVVTLNGRRLGLYGIKEGFTREFLAGAFPGPPGNLYEPEPGPGCDVDGPMKLNLGPGPTNRADLAALASALAEPNPSKRWIDLGAVLNRDRFITFLALETLIGHRDGYGQARNNYRIHGHPGTGQFEFLPSGLDRLFARPDAPLFPRFSGLVAQAVLGTDEGHAAYRAHLGTLFTNHFQDPAWLRAIPAQASALGRALPASEARALQRAGAELVERVQRRIAFVARELAKPAPFPLPMTNGVALLLAWRATDAPDGGRLEQRLESGRVQLGIHAGPRTAASWRTNPMLAQGRYVFEARVRTQGFAPLPFGRKQGATLTINGQSPSRTRWLDRDAPWSVVRAEFEVAEPGRETELACVLRASAGEAWFEAPLLRQKP